MDIFTYLGPYRYLNQTRTKFREFQTRNGADLPERGFRGVRLGYPNFVQILSPKTIWIFSHIQVRIDIRIRPEPNFANSGPRNGADLPKRGFRGVLLGYPNFVQILSPKTIWIFSHIQVRIDIRIRPEPNFTNFGPETEQICQNEFYGGSPRVPKFRSNFESENHMDIFTYLGPYRYLNQT